MIKNNKNMNSSKKSKKRYLIIITLCIVFILFFILFRTIFYKSPEEQLAAIEESLTIPDSENAAILYNQFFEDYNESDLAYPFLTSDIDNFTASVPWSSRDYPELAKWLEERQNIIEKLFEISKYEKCVFSINNSELISSNLSLIRQSAFILIRAAQNDIAEGRIEKALEKFICCIRIGRHFSHQAIDIDFIVGIGIEAASLQRIRNLIMLEDTKEEQIQTIKAILPDKKLDEWFKVLLQVESLNNKIISEKVFKSKGFSLLYRLKQKLLNTNVFGTNLENFKETYFRSIANRKGTQILIALKQYKNKTGKWPGKLDEIKPFLSSEDILIDPQNKNAFVYKTDNDSFIFYSTGPNGIDENGNTRAPADDLLIWPTQIPQVQSQNINYE